MSDSVQSELQLETGQSRDAGSIRPFSGKSTSSELSAAEKAVLQAKALEILRREFPAPAEPGRQASVSVEIPAGELEVIPARMLNEFVYCQRLFFYEFVEGVFVESADTLRGAALHQRVDSGKGDAPAPAKSREGSNGGTPNDSPGATAASVPQAPEVIHSRSVQMGSARHGVVAKLDLIEAKVCSDERDSQTAQEVIPVDYKAGAPREGADGNEIWDTDKMQLGVQALILRENGYACNEAVIYYRATKQRVRLAITTELERWVLEKIAEARKVSRGPMPGPLVNSPKCVGCSLAPVCLPDETRLLADEPAASEPTPPLQLTAPRRLMAARDDARALYLNTPGLRVGCKDEVLQVKERDKLIEELRMRDLNHVALFGNIQISTQAVQTLCEREIPITYFSMGGWFYGITRGHGLKNVFLRIEQFRLVRDRQTALSFARRFVNGKIRNHRTMLMRNHVEAPAPVLLKLKRAADDALGAVSMEELLGIEGAAASLYFQNFNGMIKTAEDAGAPGAISDASERSAFNFNFDGRNRRPPTDPVNAMLSLAYSLLGKDCALAVLAVGFDPYVGFYHQPRFGRAALGLDLMEEFRPLVAESVVLNCINNRVITPGDFVRAGEAINLSAAGRKKFFQTYEQRMNSLLTHPLFDYKVSYRRALELQARLLAKALTGEILEYIPLMTR